jgi:uncharacterized membrane protein
MGFFDTVWHAVGFMLPAVFMALFLPCTKVIFKPKQPLAPVFIIQSAIIFIACLLTLFAGLFIAGRDGRMLTYAAMVLVAATTQWILNGGWRK